MTVKRLTRDAIMLAILCVVGMFAIPMGDNIKVSLQFLILIIIFGLTEGLIDKIIIPSLYVALGLVVPIYAGFMAGITPTFGFVLGFILAGIPFHFINKYLKINFYIRFSLACLSSLLIIYIVGVIFMKFYLNISLGATLMIAVVPYIAFDITKILIAALILNLMPKKIKNSK